MLGPEVHSSFSEMIETLSEARQAVRDDIERCSGSGSEVSDRLICLLEAVRRFEGLADSLLIIMIERDPLNLKTAEVEDLLEFFNQAEIRLISSLETDRGRG